MHQLQSTITEQMTAASAALADACADGDDYLVGIYQAELDALATTAAAHDLVIDLRGPAAARAC
ncbi:hypothetical protein [Angustibacter aerolatus]